MPGSQNEGSKKMNPKKSRNKTSETQGNNSFLFFLNSTCRRKGVKEQVVIYGSNLDD